MKAFRALLAPIAALMLSGSARGELIISLVSALQNSAVGREIVFSGSLTNNSATEKLYLNEVSITLSGASAANLVLKPNEFYANVPGVLLPGETYSDSEIFRILLQSSAPPGDYGGTVALRGGANITADVDLTRSGFAILSPAVSIVATDASASEAGPDTGLFTLSRSGSTAIDLPVSVTPSGTAVSGVDYTSFPVLFTIPAGSSSASVTILPVPDNIAQGDRSVVWNVAPEPIYNLGPATSAVITIHDKPADAWRFENFGANANEPEAADAADWDHDGIPNLLEFALGLNPKVPEVRALPFAAKSGGYLAISFLPNANATDVNIAVEASTDLLRWSSADVESLNVAPPAYRYRIPIMQSDRAYLRLHVFRTDL